jgi:hypothetical protein
MSQHAAVTAKVECTRRTPGYNDSVMLSFGPDYQSGRNAEWAEATPSLSLQMTVKASVAENFELGSSYTLTFEPNAD